MCRGTHLEPGVSKSIFTGYLQMKYQETDRTYGPATTTNNLALMNF